LEQCGWNTFENDRSFLELIDMHCHNFERRIENGQKFKLGIEIMKNKYLFTLVIEFPSLIVQPFVVDIDQYNSYHEGDGDYQILGFEIHSEDIESTIPPYFTLRNDYGNRLNENEWEMIAHDYHYLIHGSEIDIQKMIRELEPNQERMVYLELRKK
jgi:hypothetical protein